MEDAGEEDDTDISDDDVTLLSRCNEAACFNESVGPTVVSSSFKEGVRTYYNQPELYHQRWKDKFLASNPALKERLLGLGRQFKDQVLDE